MRLTIFLSLSTLFCSNFIQVISIERDAAYAYQKLVIDKKDNDNEFTDFCLNTNQMTLAYVCDRALEKLRRNHPYNDVYLYPFLIHSKPPCVEGSVVLDETSTKFQYMKTCIAGSAIVSDTINNRNKIMVFAKSLHSIFIFKKQKATTNYNTTVLDWFIESDYSFNVESETSSIFAENRLISPKLFKIRPPMYLKGYMSWRGYENYIPTTTLINGNNIIHRSDERKFAKLCMMVLRRAEYHDVIVDVISLVQKKPKTIDFEVKVDDTFRKTTARPCHTYKLVAHFTISELQQIFNPEEVEKLKSFKLKDDILGYELSPQDIKEALNLNFDMLKEKMDKIEYMLTVTSNSITYFLAQVTDKNSVSIIRKMTADESEMEYKWLEGIINISDEYLERMDLHNEKKYLMRLLELQEKERLILEQRNNSIWFPKDTETNSNKRNYYDGLFQKLHKEYKIHWKNRISL